MEYEIILGLTLAICFLGFINMISAFLPRNGELIKMIGFVIGIVLIIDICARGYDVYKYKTASVEKVNNIKVVDKKPTAIGYETIVKYSGKRYETNDGDLYKNVKIGERLKGHVVKGTNELHDVDGYQVTKR